jgi:hypothetical protein
MADQYRRDEIPEGTDSELVAAWMAGVDRYIVLNQNCRAFEDGDCSVDDPAWVAADEERAVVFCQIRRLWEKISGRDWSMGIYAESI